jgi:Recombination endonuclease VII
MRPHASVHPTQLPTFDVDAMCREYVEDRVRTKALAKKYGVEPGTILTHLRKRGLVWRKAGCQSKYEPVAEGFKTCNKCGQLKPNEDFPIQRCRPDGLRNECKLCHHERSHWVGIKRRYGVTKEQFERMLADQDGKCYICGQPETYLGRERLSIDHCHVTAEVRKLLCHRCNISLGHLEDNVNLVTKMLSYIIEHRNTTMSNNFAGAI